MTDNDQALTPFPRNRNGRIAASAESARTGQVSLHRGRSHPTETGWVSSQTAGRSAANADRIRRFVGTQRSQVCDNIASTPTVDIAQPRGRSQGRKGSEPLWQMILRAAVHGNMKNRAAFCKWSGTSRAAGL